MRTLTRQHLSVVGGLAKFARVTVGRAEQAMGACEPVEPQIILNQRVLPSLSDGDREALQAAERGIRETEADLGWQGARHFVVKVEGFEVDGIDAEAARLAAHQATRDMIEQ